LNVGQWLNNLILIMTIISVNVGTPREVKWQRQTVLTSIFKEPVRHRVHVQSLNIEGDEQADPTVHGGKDKAIYTYAAEHYALWKKELRRDDLPWGMFGENLTVAGGLFEADIAIGDRFAIGSAEIMAIQPRLPCFKLGIRFGSQRMVKKFAVSMRYGVYFRVVKEGAIGTGDTMTLVAKSQYDLSILDLGRLLMNKTDDRSLIERAAKIEFLPSDMREYFRSLLL
jgi:MOSC domain-containing protein YiiM